MKYFIVDVFCKGKYSGNQLAVVLSPSSLSGEMMQVIANEFHFSETSFILENNQHEGLYRVRIFTPQNEVPFAGHPTLGSAFIIRNEFETRSCKQVILDLDVGKIPVTFDDDQDIQWMRQIEPTFGSLHHQNAIAQLLGLTPDEMDERFPVQAVSTGIEFLLVPLKDLNAVRKASLNLGRYREYFTGSKHLPMFIFCPETYEKTNAIHCRMFADDLGIPEDPATGSANGCLAAYLTHYQYFGSREIGISVEQGYEMGRQSILYIKSNLEKNRYNIEVGGKVKMIAQGELI